MAKGESAFSLLLFWHAELTFLIAPKSGPFRAVNTC
jgi:hypothetical protein